MSMDGKLALLQLVDDFVFGHSLRTAEVETWVRDSDLARSAEALAQRHFKTGDLPRTAALFARAGSRDLARHPQWLTEERFERALAAVLDGAARLLPRAARSARRPKSRRNSIAGLQ